MEKEGCPQHFAQSVVLRWLPTLAHAFMAICEMAMAFFHHARKLETKTRGLRQINPPRVEQQYNLDPVVPLWRTYSLVQYGWEDEQIGDVGHHNTPAGTWHQLLNCFSSWNTRHCLPPEICGDAGKNRGQDEVKGDEKHGGKAARSES